jgi:hypothetical protein
MTNGGQPAGWYADPWGQAPRRYWDGAQWTEHTDAPAAAPVATAPPAPGPTPPPSASGGYGVPQGGYAAAPGYNGAPAMGVAPTTGPPGGSNLSLEGSRSLLWVVVAGVALIALGSFLPWASVTLFGAEITIDGMDGDGPITLFGAFVVGALMLAAHLQRPSTAKVVTSLVFAALVTLVAIVDIVDVQSRVADVEGGVGLDVDASIGVGLWMVLLGGVVATAGTALTLPKLKR